MANFEAPVLISAVTTAYKTAGFLWAGGTKRAQLYEIEMGQTGALASTDCQVQWDLSRAATPTLAGTTVAANLLDTADYTATTLFINAASAEPTYTTAGNGLALKSWGINQRGSYRWRALDDGDNIIIPSTAGVGVGLRANSSNFTSSAIGNISFIER
jgi:hypothetical protein